MGTAHGDLVGRCESRIRTLDLDGLLPAQVSAYRTATLATQTEAEGDNKAGDLHVLLVVRENNVTWTIPHIKLF